MTAMYWMGLMLLLAMTLDGCSNQSHKSGRPEEPLKLEAPYEVEAGQTVNLKLIWRNLTDKPVALTLGGRPAYDFVATTPEGKEVWRWLAGEVVQDILEMKTVGPGQKLEFTLEWQPADQSGAALAPGNYLVQGILNLEPRDRKKPGGDRVKFSKISACLNLRNQTSTNSESSCLG